MLKKYPPRLDDPKEFKMFMTRLDIITRRRRQSFDIPDNTPLDPREARALAAISKQMQRQMNALPPEARSKAEATVEEAIGTLGTRGYLNLFLVEPKVMGVSYSWFAVCMLVCCVLFLVDRDSPFTMFVGVFGYAIGWVVCPPRMKKQREESIQRLLGETFPTE